MNTTLFKDIDKKSKTRIMLEHIDLVKLNQEHTLKDIAKMFGLNYSMLINEMQVQFSDKLNKSKVRLYNYDEFKDPTLIKDGAWTESKERQYLKSTNK